METPTLTREQIEQAKIESHHPIVQLFWRMQDSIANYSRRYDLVKGDNKERQKFVRENMGFVAEKLNKLEKFSLGPLDLISIWTSVCGDFVGYTRYNLAAQIPATYATRKIKDPNWSIVVPRIAAREIELPEELMSDRENVLNFYKGLAEVRSSLKEIDLYMYGTREDNFELTVKAFRKGDEKAKRELEESKRWFEEHEDPVLCEIKENFGNGFTPLFFNLPEDIRREVFSD